jgi:hypothetical protein
VVHNLNPTFGELRKKILGDLNFNVKVWNIKSFLVSALQSLATAKLWTAKNEKFSALKSLATILGGPKKNFFHHSKFPRAGYHALLKFCNWCKR